MEDAKSSVCLTRPDMHYFGSLFSLLSKLKRKEQLTCRCIGSWTDVCHLICFQEGEKKERIIINRLSRVFKDHIYNMAGSNQTSRKFLLFVGSWFTPNGEIDYHCRLGSLYGFVVLDVGPLLELGRLGGSNVEMVNDEYR